ncbi:protein DpdF [Rhizobium ruizarguesonis]|uniref:protein DpdF n=1 Tax=Rhizobium ruizarguesonis TaxID=2081791 RepID=UPI001CF48AC9|nr:protein DpdF [Rhizobium ruizarguesonis]MCB2399369.1 DEAD/DEAH box helicase [Rhizobium ruizarguesonis]
MDRLSGHNEFEALKHLLSGTDVSGTWRGESPAVERLRAALCESSQAVSQLDLAVLLRQALLREYARRAYETSPTLLIGHPRFNLFDKWGKVGLLAVSFPSGNFVTARDWQPDWLPKPAKGGVDTLASSETIERVFNAEGTDGDPLLASVGRQSYRSRGQRAAVRTALSTPPGGTLVIALPTGEGKSMIFQLAHKVGFVGSNPGRKGVTLVIVPTVALGVNHEQEAVDVCGLTRPLAFQGGSDAQNSIIADRIADGSQGLCFASPEAACNRLRLPLRQAAEAGLLRAIVVDEAHLVDQWGTGFRSEFQELSGLRRELIAKAPPEQQLRTLLLSATLTDSSLETLRMLFGTDGQFESIAAVQLRPEPDYWIAQKTNESTRVDRVIEALHHAPRPAVLYVTEVADADFWHRRLVEEGFRRVRKLHGQTNRGDRERIVSDWRDGSLDVVVGTSAFGLGIDYAHARTIIHACVPETLDRFYQEVGRGGRDGMVSLSLAIPSMKDYATADGISRKKVISVERGHHRWSTMFARKLMLGNGRFAVRVDGRPGAGEDDIDMAGETNTDWNLRTLALMARSDLIKLMGTPQQTIENEGDWLEIEVLDDHHLENKSWVAKVEKVRLGDWTASKRNLDLMRDFLKDEHCPAEILEKLYGAHRLARRCSRCSICRMDPDKKHNSRPVGEPIGPWVHPLHPAVERLLDKNLKLLVTYDHENMPRAASRRLGDTLQRLQQANVSKLLLLGAQSFDMDRILRFAVDAPFFVTTVTSLGLSRLPKGPEVVMVGRNQLLEEQNLAARPESPRIILTPLSQVAPDGRRLRDVFGGRVLTLDEFNERVSR